MTIDTPAQAAGDPEDGSASAQQAVLPGLTNITGGRFNDDAYYDLLGVEAATGELWLYPGTATPGVLGNRVLVGKGGWNGMRELTGGEYTGDQIDDLIAVETSTGKLWLYPGTASGAFGARVLIGLAGWNGMQMLTGGEYTGDGHPDLIAVEQNTGKVWIYPGPNPGSMAARVPLRLLPEPDTTPTAADRYGWGTPLPASDEFDYGSPDTPAVPDQTKWVGGGTDSWCGTGNNNNGRRCDANSRVLGGFLRITGMSDGDTGVVASLTSQQYGRWEVRARSQATGADNGRQYHPVLLLWPDSNTWPQDGEYDYLENSSPGEPCAGAFMHYPIAGMRQESAVKCDVDLTQWHNFGFEWTPDHVTGFIDGEEWFTFGEPFGPGCIQCAPHVMHQSLQLDNFDGDNMQPATLDVDWARVYEIPGVSVADAPSGNAG